MNREQIDKLNSLVDEINEKSNSKSSSSYSQSVNYSKPGRKEEIDNEHSRDLSRI